jgi:hypothetical protein
MEVQSHGVLFEDNIVRAITGVSKDEYQTELPNGYTASMDVVKGIKSNANYSIKVSKDGKSIGCGDILRIVEHCKNNEFTMVVGAWRQISPTVKRYDCIYEFDIRPEHYQKLWSGITENALESFVQYVKEIPHGPQGQELHKKLWKQKRQQIYDTHGQGLFKIDAKIDSKNQRRVQCSIKIKDLIETKEITYRKYDTEYKGIPLPYEQNSSPRQFSQT